MEYLKLAGIFIGASAFWKAIEALLHFGVQKKLKKAEVRNLNEQANEKVIGKWIVWSEKMEARIDEVEKDNKEMKQIVISQRTRINDLEKNNKEMKQTISNQRNRINELEKYIEQLEGKLKQYQNNK